MNKKIGLLVPSTNTVCEVDFHKMAPPKVTVHTARMNVLEYNNEQVDWDAPMDWEGMHHRMHEHCEDAAKSLAAARVDVITFGCTSGSFLKGKVFNKILSRRIAEAVFPICGSIPVITTSTALVEALKALNIMHVSVATPYTDEGNEQEKKYLEDNGFNVIDIKGLNLDKYGDYALQDPETIYDLAKSVNKKSAEGIFISCTDFNGSSIIEELEKELAKPVISSTQISMWLALRSINLEMNIAGYGALLRQE